MDKVNGTFGTENVNGPAGPPRGDSAKEKALLAHLETYDEVDYAMGLS